MTEDRWAYDELFYRIIIFPIKFIIITWNYVNKLNCRVWRSKNPHVVEVKPCFCAKTTMHGEDPHPASGSPAENVVKNDLSIGLVEENCENNVKSWATRILQIQ